jgi:hypothetical protein
MTNLLAGPLSISQAFLKHRNILMNNVLGGHLPSSSIRGDSPNLGATLNFTPPYGHDR